MSQRKEILDIALKLTLGIEGDYSNDPKDSGGKTRYGITEAKARSWGYQGEMKDFPLDLAKTIYEVDYWDAIQLDRVSDKSIALALEMFDTGVNCGIHKPVVFLQRLLNVLNREERDYPDIKVDGIIGSMTLSSLEAFLNKRGKKGEEVLVSVMNAQQAVFYMELAEKREKDETFVYGWFVNRVL